MHGGASRSDGSVSFGRSHAWKASIPSASSAAATSDAASVASPPSSSDRIRPPLPAPVREDFWEWEGHRIRYQSAGTDGPAMILVHGFGGNADHWRKNTPVLGRKGRVFAIDLLGYGYSSKPNPMQGEPNTVYTFENWARQLQSFIDEVVGEPAFIMCNSVGSVAGLQAAVDKPSNVRGVVMINPSLRGLHVKKQPAMIKPFVKALQTTLRTTDIGKKFFGNVAQAKTVKNILKEAYGNPDTVTDELVDVILKPGLQAGPFSSRDVVIAPVSR